jgi:hypothetical protein
MIRPLLDAIRGTGFCGHKWKIARPAQGGVAACFRREIKIVAGFSGWCGRDLLNGCTTQRSFAIFAGPLKGGKLAPAWI